MNTLRVLATLVISVGCARAARFTEQPSSAQRQGLGGVMAAALIDAAPQTGLADANPASCPYRFDSDMPSDTFCVYRGIAFGRAGEVCASDVVVIWSSLTSQARLRRRLTEKASASNGEVNLGFVTDPELVVRAIPWHSDRAEIVWYTRGGDEAPQALAGQMRLRAVRSGSVDILSMDMDLREPGRFHIGSCAFASYSGTFVGVIRPPSDNPQRKPEDRTVGLVGRCRYVSAVGLENIGGVVTNAGV